MMKKTHAVEKSRDWLLNKLRSAKKDYNTLNKERQRIYEHFDVEMSLSQASLTDNNSIASNYTLELEGIGGFDKKKKIPLGHKKNRSFKPTKSASFSTDD